MGRKINSNEADTRRTLHPESALSAAPSPVGETRDSSSLEEYDSDFGRFSKPDDKLIADIMRRRKNSRTNVPSDPVRQTAFPAPRPPEGHQHEDRPDIAVAEALPVRLMSSGRTLIIGYDPDLVRSCVQRLSPTLTCLAVLDMIQSPAGATPLGLNHPVQVADIRIEGYFGRFRAIGDAGSGDVPLSRLLSDGPEDFDLVLDLRPTADQARGPVPLGYFNVPQGDGAALEQSLDQLPQLIGEFEKQPFIDYTARDCAHRAGARTVCRACLDICPTEALGSKDGRIWINHAACADCGLCTVVCPSGALHCRLLPPQELLVAVQARISEALLDQPKPPTLRFFQSQADPAGQNLTETAFELPAIGCAGPEIWLSALAYGAGQILVQMPEGFPEHLKNVFEGQRAWAADMLSQLGLDSQRIQITTRQTAEGQMPASYSTPFEPAEFSPFQSKRALIRSSVAHLAAGAAFAGDRIDLNGPAPFGAVAVNADACTLCMACVGACPTQSLTGTPGAPGLKWIESDCFQCGRCQYICPEKAVELRPGFLLDPAALSRPEALCTQEPAICPGCGQAFAPAAMVANMIQRLEGHWLYPDAHALRRLTLCRDCRIRDFFNSKQ